MSASPKKFDPTAIRMFLLLWFFTGVAVSLGFGEYIFTKPVRYITSGKPFVPREVWNFRKNLDSLDSYDPSQAPSYLDPLYRITNRKLIRLISEGLAFANRAEYLKSVENFHSAETMTERKKVKLALIGLGARSYLDAGSLEFAKKEFQRMLSSAVDSDNSDARAVAHTGLAMVCRKRGDNRTAEKHCYQALDNTDDAYLRFLNYYMSAEAMWLQGEKNQTFSNLKKAGEKAEDLDSPESSYLVYNRMAEYHRSSGNLKPAYSASKKSLEYARQLGDSNAVIKHLLNLAHIAFRENRYLGSSGFAKEAMPLCQAQGDSVGIMYSCFYIGIRCKADEMWGRASSYLDSALVIAKQLNEDSLTGVILMHLGYCFYQKSDYRKSLEYSMESTDVSGRLEDRVTEGMAHYNIGLVLVENRDFQGAIKHFTLARDLFAETDHHKGEASSERGISHVRYLLDHPDAIDR